MLRLFFLLAFLVPAQGFTVLPRIRTVTSPVQLKAALTSEELQAIISRAHECEKGECSVDAVDDLIAELQENQHILNERIKDLNNMIASLEILNEKENRDHDEVRETVRAIFRLFAMGAKASGNDYPSLGKPTGYSGEVGSGPTDAYKALNPKTWKPSQSP